MKKGESLSRDITLQLDPGNESYRIVAFAQEAGQGKVLGAAMSEVK
jgi:hypothetical protein